MNDPNDHFSPEEKEALKNFSLTGLSMAMGELQRANEKLTKQVQQLKYDLEDLDDYITRSEQADN
jgi:hypothetical protein